MKLPPATAGLIALLTMSLALGPAQAAVPSAWLLPEVTFSSTGLEGSSLPRLVPVAIGLDAPSKAQQEWLVNAAAAAIATSGRFALVPNADLTDPAGWRTRANNAFEAEALMNSGAKALDDLDAQKAVQLFTDAMAAWRQADLADETVFNQYVKSWVMKTASQVAKGDIGVAKVELEKILVIAPKTSFPDALFPPDLLKLVESQRRSIGKAVGQLTLSSDPPGAKIWVDGLLRGIAPLKVTNLAGGKHVVVALRAGYARVTDDLPLGAELVKLSPMEGAAKVDALEDKAVRDPDGPGRDAAGRALASIVQAEQALVLVAKKSTAGESLELTAVRLEAHDGHNLGYRRGVVAIGDDSGLAMFLAGLLASNAPRNGKLAVSHFGGASGGGRKTSAIVLFGVAAAAIGVGIFSGVSANMRANEFRATPQVQSQIGTNLAFEGRSYALVADVSYLVGAAAAITGAVLLLTGRTSLRAVDEPKSAETVENPPF